MCEEVGDYEGVREDLEAMMPGASAHGSFAMALVQREQEFASDCARCAHPKQREGVGASCMCPHCAGPNTSSQFWLLLVRGAALIANAWGVNPA